MNIKTLNISLLSFSIITALFPLNAMATKLLKYQRHLPSLITSKMKTVNRTRLPQRIL